MKYTGPVYRPPYEANTLLLQVTVGCAHNKCTFCTMYRDVQFGVEQIDQVEKDLQEAQQFNGNVKRIFLVNGDAFVLNARRLKEIAEKIHHYLPKVETITMYASINNIMHKSDEDLAELAKLGIGDLWSTKGPQTPFVRLKLAITHYYSVVPRAEPTASCRPKGAHIGGIRGDSLRHPRRSALWA